MTHNNILFLANFLYSFLLLIIQVCTHIVQAIRKEATALREEWEGRLCSATPGLITAEAPDTYCFEMLSMVLALSGSSVGRSYLAQQHGLLTDLLSLLHTGSARVQRQVYYQLWYCSTFMLNCLYSILCTLIILYSY